MSEDGIVCLLTFRAEKITTFALNRGCGGGCGVDVWFAFLVQPHKTRQCSQLSSVWVSIVHVKNSGFSVPLDVMRLSIILLNNVCFAMLYF